MITRKPAPRTARRVSGPVRGRLAVSAPGARTQRPRSGLGARALELLRSLPDHRWLDRAVRGRTWILMLGVMLAGIVAMQVEVLKLGASIGRSVEQTAALQSRNELLRASVASLSDDQRIERIAASMGMVMPAPSTVSFLSSRPGTIARAARSIHAPDPASFLQALAASAAATSNPPSSSTTPSVTGAAVAGGAAGSAALAPASATSSTGSSATAAPATSAPAATAPAATAPAATAPAATTPAAAAPSQSTSGGAAPSAG